MLEPLIAPDADADRLRLRPYEVTLPSGFRAEFDEMIYPYRIELHLTFDGDRVLCDELTCFQRANGEPVTSGGMSKVRAAEIISIVARAALRDTRGAFLEDLGAVEISSEFRVDQFEPPAGPTDEQLRQLGVLYTVAYACGASPRRRVIEDMTLPRSTANRWIRLARERGYLLVGEQDDERE